jgi:predicted transcriptional regulator
LPMFPTMSFLSPAFMRADSRTIGPGSGDMRSKETRALYLPAPRLNQYNILIEVGSDPGITQAELARKCGLSVAMVNNYMKELCACGFLEYHRKSSKSVSYHLTPAGKESIDATRQDLLREVTSLFEDAKARFRELAAS